MSTILPNIGNIQGNIFGGFNKDFETLLFVQFTDPVKGRSWVQNIAQLIASSEEVIAFNNLFKVVRARHGEEGVVKATWTNIAFTHSGLAALQVDLGDLNDFPAAFRQGMAARAAKIGDAGPSAPANWIEPFKSAPQNVHCVLIVASDIPEEVDPNVPHSTVARYIGNMGNNGTVKLLYTQRGATRLDIPGQAGHEHFGFKDGVSQPGIRGIDTPDVAAEPNQGNPGQDLLWPGEFVLGYPRQIREENPHIDGPNPDPGPISLNGPEWTVDGSYLVFRRLAQDVQGFRELVSNHAMELGISPTLMGAKLVGRYASGCPLERRKDQPETYTPLSVDPGIANPALANDNSLNNFFEYGYDPKGLNVPRAGHIRKAYPRDQPGSEASGTETESATQTHRLLRRGIPFGASLGAASHGGPHEVFPNDRGLLFLCYQRDIENQFEFVQSAWVNDKNFPCPAAGGSPCPGDGQPDGEDGVMAQSSAGTFAVPTESGTNYIPALKHFVTTTGGEYFFAPSITALYHIAQAQPPF